MSITSDFWANKPLTSFNDMTLRKLLELLEPGKAAPFYLHFQLRSKPFPAWMQHVRLPVTTASPANTSNELAARVMQLAGAVLYRCGIDILTPGEIKLATESEKLLFPETKVPQTIRWNAIEFLGDIVANLFCIGFYRLAIGVTNKVLALHTSLLEKKLIPQNNVPIGLFLERVCLAISQFWLPVEKRFLSEREEAKHTTPKPELVIKNGSEVGFCSHGLLCIFTPKACLFQQTESLRDSKCQ